MFRSGIFFFGAETFCKETKRDAITCLPLEISWKIFDFLDETSLRHASRSSKTWSQIITANKKLRNRLNKFELAIKLGSASLARFYRKNKRILRKENENGKNYLPAGKTDYAAKRKCYRCEHNLDNIVVYTKRYKLF